MGQDPKPTKRRHATADHLSPVRAATKPPVARETQRDPVQASLYQSRLPSGDAHERTVALPDMAELLEHTAGVEDDGYYKLCPGNDGKSWYLTYRWRWGPHGGHYVMAVVGRGDLRYGITLLAEKVHAVRVGSLRPTRDRFGE